MCSNQMSYDDPQMATYSPMMNVEWKEIITKAAVTGGLATAAAAFLIPGGTGSIAGMSIPGSLGVGLGCAAGSVAGDLAHKYVAPLIPQDMKYVNAESAAVSLGAAVGGAYLGMSLIGDVPIMTPILIGGGSYLASDYLYSHVLNKSTGGFVL